MFSSFQALSVGYLYGVEKGGNGRDVQNNQSCAVETPASKARLCKGKNLKESKKIKQIR